MNVTLGLSIDPGMNLLNKGVTYTNNSNTNFLNLRAKYAAGTYNAGYEGVTRIVTDRAKSNERLLAEQKNSSTPSAALFERLFYSGRYHLLASSNVTAAPDLLGNWTGDSNVGWDG